MSNGKYSIDCSGESKTQQQFKQDADINNIVRRMALHNQVPATMVAEPIYADISEAPDFQTANNIVLETEQKFFGLPSKVRARFENNPQKLMEFLNKEENRKEAEELNLIPKPKKKPIQAVSSTPEEKGAKKEEAEKAS